MRYQILSTILPVICFSLGDEDAVIRSVMFRSQNSRLKFKPEEGMKVLARGYVSIYPQGGAYQLYVDSMQPDGTGSLYMAFEQLKKVLKKKGLLTLQEKTYSMLPMAVGVYIPDRSSYSRHSTCSRKKIS